LRSTSAASKASVTAKARASAHQGRRRDMAGV
jgi:hypothetical protein